MTDNKEIPQEVKVHHGHKWMPAVYVTYYGILKDIARDHGYALAVHGTVTRDFDLVAVPWVENAKPVIELLEAFAEMIGMIREPGVPYTSKGNNPHGRTSYTLSTGSGGYLDISVMDGYLISQQALEEGDKRIRELEQALRGLHDDVWHKPNNSRYATHLKIAQQALNPTTHDQ
jgi:hypothetical protein